jgi:hypothetical protein
MKLGLLTGSAAAILLIGSIGARAETIYVPGTGVVDTPDYVYAAPDVAPAYSEPGYVVAVPRYRVIEQAPVVVAPQRRAYIVDRPTLVQPRETFDDDRGLVTTGYSSQGPCAVDAFHYERCY